MIHTNVIYFRDAKRKHIQLIKDRKVFASRISEMQETCDTMMIQKFGRLVDFERLVYLFCLFVASFIWNLYVCVCDLNLNPFSQCIPVNTNKCKTFKLTNTLITETLCMYMYCFQYCSKNLFKWLKCSVWCCFKGWKPFRWIGMSSSWLISWGLTKHSVWRRCFLGRYG